MSEDDNRMPVDEDGFSASDEAEFEYLDDADTGKSKPKRVSKLGRWFRGNVTLHLPLGTILAGLTVVVVVIILAVIFITSRLANNESSAAVALVPTAAEIDLDSIPFCSDSPVTDNQRIVMSIGNMGTTNLFITNMEGTKSCRLTNDAFSNNQPDWSPDGKQIAFSSTREGRVDVFVINADGSNLTNLTGHCRAGSASPDWSPDGTKIAMTSSCAGEAESNLYVIDLKIHQTNILIDSPDSEKLPRWSPDGRYIAFASSGGTPTQLSKEPEIYVGDADGTNIRRISNNQQFDSFPRWLPRGDGIYYEFIPECHTSPQYMVVYELDDPAAKTTDVLDISQQIPMANLIWKDATHLLFQANIEGFNALYSADMTTSPSTYKRSTAFRDVMYFDWWQRSR